MADREEKPVSTIGDTPILRSGPDAHIALHTTHSEVGSTPPATMRDAIVAYLHHSPLAAIEWRTNRTVRFWNPAAERLFGYTADELDGVDVFPLIVHSESRPHVDRIWAALLADAGGRSSINTNITKAGRVIQCRWHNSPLKDDSGKIIGVASFVEDITDRVQAHRAAIETTERLQRVIEKLPVIVWAIDDSGAPILWNESAERITGYPRSHVLGDPAAAARFGLTPQRGDYNHANRELVCADGASRRIEWSNIAGRCPVPGWNAWGVGIDVTSRHRAFDALERSERHFRNIISGVDLAGLVVDERGRITFVNGAFLRVTRRTERDLMGRDWAEIVGPAVGQTPVTPVGGTSDSTAFPTRIESVLLTADSEERSLTWTRSLLRGPDGEISGAVALGMDVTDHRRVESELADYRDHLEELVEHRTKALADSERRLRDAERLTALGQVAAGLNHDLGNVLLPVRCHLDTLAGADLDDKCREAVHAVTHGFKLLEHLGEGLELLGGSSNPNRADLAAATPLIHPDDWWTDARALLIRVIPDDVAFSARIEPELPAIHLPAHQLTRAVMNLLVNAVEATHHLDHPRKVSLTVALDRNSGDVEWKVEDNGSGIKGPIHRRLVEPFFSTKPRSLSTGLGLSIVNAVATLAGGTFEISDRPDGGARAVIRIPARCHQGGVRIAVVANNSRLQAVVEENVSIFDAQLSSLADADAVVLAVPKGAAVEHISAGRPVVRISLDGESGSGVGQGRGITTAGIQDAIREAIRLGEATRE